jgi:hypothetical protein
MNAALRALTAADRYVWYLECRDFDNVERGSELSKKNLRLSASEALRRSAAKCRIGPARWHML